MARYELYYPPDTNNCISMVRKWITCIRCCKVGQTLHFGLLYLKTRNVITRNVMQSFLFLLSLSLSLSPLSLSFMSLFEFQKFVAHAYSQKAMSFAFYQVFASTSNLRLVLMTSLLVIAYPFISVVFLAYQGDVLTKLLRTP